MRNSVDERTTPDEVPVTASRGFSVIAAGALLAVVLAALVGSVVWVSNSSNQPLVQPKPSPPPTAAPTSSPTVAADPLPPPVTTTEPPPAATPVFAMPSSQVTAEMITPPPTFPRHPLLHQLFPQLFPSE
ncbi:MAG TPA: hypothetical protein VL634_00650 [Mycobacterium sp.]|nr:hypothetical protein [Mycobacterium sp.]